MCNELHNTDSKATKRITKNKTHFDIKRKQYKNMSLIFSPQSMSILFITSTKTKKRGIKAQLTKKVQNRGIEAMLIHPNQIYCGWGGCKHKS